VTVAQSTTAISTALAAFAHAYNAVVAEIDNNRGQTGGPLSGDSSLISMQESLRRLVNFTGTSGGITSLTQLGLEFTQQGILTFNPSKLNGLSQADIAQAVSFLGDPLSGGFLKAANDNLNGLVDPISGLVSGELQSLEKQSQQEAKAIADAQDRVNLLQANLTAQMAAADALIATLQQQTQFISGLFNIPKLNANGTLSTTN
jgi:flagellar hook-associated protein 2